MDLGVECAPPHLTSHNSAWELVAICNLLVIERLRLKDAGMFGFQVSYQSVDETGQLS